MKKTALLALEDGTLFYGQSIGAEGSATGEVVFNTSMTGYQEIITDPSYRRQIVTLTYPHIGNVGINPIDTESAGAQIGGLVIRDLPRRVSNFRSTLDLGSYLKQQGIVAISGIDTRKLTRLLRDKGAQKGTIQTAPFNVVKAIEAAKAFSGLSGLDLASEVTRDAPNTWLRGSWKLAMQHLDSPEKTPADIQYRVVAYDFGVKETILRLLVDRHCELFVVPARTPASEVLALNPDGVFLSNGPGDPAPCDYAINAIHDIVEAGVPVFGICLGHQLLGLACGARTEKMKFGHHGCNHPVIDLKTGKVLITTQNHGFAIDRESLPAHLIETHRSLFDGTLQGIHHASQPAFSFQGHPEASSGPHDVVYLFDHFIDLMRDYQARQAT